MEEVDIADIDGVGTVMAKKLNSVGINSVYHLATETSFQLAEKLNVTVVKARELTEAANKLLADRELIPKSLRSAKEVLKERLDLPLLSTGSLALDNLLKGGIEATSITEFYGEFGSGKTQLFLTLSANCPFDGDRWQGGGVLYVDTEGTFRPERLSQIAEGRGLDLDKILESVINIRVESASHLEVIVRNLATYIEQYKIKLIIVDSITNLHRAEFPGRGMLADRQQKLNLIMLKLHGLASKYKVAVVIANQVSHNPEGMFGDPVKPIGGNVIGHNSTYRLYLRRSGADRIARMVDSPNHAYAECRFTVNEKGIDDLAEKDKK